MLSQLDPQQLAAATAGEDMVLCLAGAGAGKTRTLVERIAHLTEDCQISPYEILSITFTRKAAGELRERLEARIGSAAYRVEVGTIHAVALRLLMRFGEMIGYKPKALTVYSEWESAYLLRECAIDLGIYNGKSWKIPKRDINAMFGRYYSTGVEPEADHPAHALFAEFCRRCRENNSLTYGGILLGLRLLLPKVAGFLGWRHILVDETQDNDLLQWEIVLKMVALLGAHLFAVGDVDQSIYRFRGATPEWLVENAARFAVYKIENNYRSCPEVVLAANSLIEHNTERLPKTMLPAKTLQGVVKVERDMDSGRIAGFIRGLVSRREPAGVPAGEIAVLARTHILLESLEEHLTYAGVPCNRIGRKAELTNSQEFRRFHAFLKLRINPYDNFAFLLIRDFVGIGRAEYAEIRLTATREAKSHFQAWLDTDDGTPSTWIEWFKNSSAKDNLAEVVRQLTSDPEAELPGLDIAGIPEFIQEWATANPKGTIADYLAWLATYDLQDELAAAPADAIQLMTVHAAKGLEWPLVIIAGCNEGILPSKRATSPEDIEDERRIMYVAMTRARDGLVLAVRPVAKADGAGRVHLNPPSRFLNECQETKAPAARAEA